MLNRKASHLGKKEALNIPLIHHLVTPLDFIMVGRDKKDSKAHRDALINDLAKRQELAERGEALPVNIFPEGGTTNGESLLHFKRGAFAALRKVQPFYTKYYSFTGAAI